MSGAGANGNRLVRCEVKTSGEAASALYQYALKETAGVHPSAS